MIQSDQLLEIQKYFAKHKYVVIKNFLDPNIVGLIYRYAINRTRAMDFKYTYEKTLWDSDWDGQWEDPQSPGAYSSYGDVLMETILASVVTNMSQYTGLNLIPNYSYWRMYQKGNDLKRHRDRHSCEISTTVCLGYDTSNLDKTQHPDYCWPIWVEDATGENAEGIQVNLQPGDMIVYRGCEVDHWRDSYLGLSHAQAFLHFNEVKEAGQQMFDGRPIIGIPKKFQVDFTK